MTKYMNNNQIQLKDKPQFFTDFDLPEVSDFSCLDKPEKQTNFFQQDLSLTQKPLPKKQATKNFAITYGHCNIEMPALDEYDFEDEFFLQFGL